VGLIAREIEGRGIPTLSMSSALSITAAANPPRAVYLDYPLGHTAGKVNDADNQMAIMRATLAAFSQISEPGSIKKLPFRWSDNDDWKDTVMRPSANKASTSDHEDDRTQRNADPQYQSAEDAAAADPNCPSCIFLEDAK